MARGDQVEVVYYRSQRKVCSVGMSCPDMRLYSMGGVPLLCDHEKHLSPHGDTNVKLFVDNPGRPRSRFTKAERYIKEHPEHWTGRSSEMLI